MFVLTVISLRFVLTISFILVIEFQHCFTSVGGVKVSIVAFQAIDPGSIPG